MSVYLKLMAVQSELKAAKNQYNSFGKYKYRNCEDILEALKPLLLKNKCVVLISDEVEVVGERYYVTAVARFIDAETGEQVSASAKAREAADKKGMDASQVTGATSSYARKYALNGLFAIDDTKDADSGQSPSSKPTEANKTSLSDKQIARLMAIANKSNYSEEDVSNIIKKKYGLDSKKQLNKTQYDEVCKGIEANPKTK